MAYKLVSHESWERLIGRLSDTMRKWGVKPNDWTVAPQRVDGRLRWWSPADRRVTVTFRRGSSEPQSFSLDNQERPVDNLHALVLALEAMRMNEQRGIGELLREMYTALPAPKTERDPYEVLGVRPDASMALIERAYTIAAQEAHPDRGGSNEAMTEVNRAIERIRQERGQR